MFKDLLRAMLGTFGPALAAALVEIVNASVHRLADAIDGATDADVKVKSHGPAMSVTTTQQTADTATGEIAQDDFEAPEGGDRG